jgi:ADP-ribosylglycohydrolase
MSDIPILHTCTAERAAYRNLVNLIPPPESASFRNPYREWIGAQIRADFFGYAAPGNPELAAEFAWRDACISHVKNGIYGEMFVAAMLAAAYVESGVRSVIEAGLAQVPANCRLTKDIRLVLAWHAEGISYDEAVERLHAAWDENKAHDWCHTISNAMVVVIGLLWGEGDYGKSICRSVQPCFDTDCNGATVGSIMGVLLGAKNLPGRWIEPMHDTLHTGVAGYNVVRISDMAKETLRQIERVQGA